MENNKPSIKKNLALSMAYQLLTFLTPLLTAPYVARVLGPDGVGIASFTESIQYYFSMFAALGTTMYGAREIARVRDDETQRSRLFWEIELLTVLTTLACLCVWAGWILYTDTYRLYYMILTMGILGTLFDISWFFTGMEMFQYIVTRNSLVKLGSVAATFLFVRDAGDTAVYVAIFAASTLLGNLSMWLYLPRFAQKLEVKSVRLWIHFRETLIYFIPTVAISLYTVLDKTLLGALVGSTAENGFYEQATKIINLGKSFTFTALNSVLGARVSFLFAQEEYEKIHEHIAQSMDYVFGIGSLLVFGIIGTAPVFVPWFFGAGYERVIPLMQLLSPIILIIGISNVLEFQYYTPAGLRKTSAKFLIIGACVNVVLNVFLIPELWAVGAVIASLLAEMVISGLFLRNCGDYLSMSLIIRKAWRKLAAGVMMLGLVLFLNLYLTPYTRLIQLMASIIGGTFAYCLVLYLLKDTFVWKGIGLIRSKFQR